MLVDKETEQEDIMFAVDGTIHKAAIRMTDFVNGNNINTEKKFCYLKKVECFCN